ncbi:von Willebrand factor D and EGF domain-containing protein isoform X2 [Antennarius striatus]|uniref:von Willebrand factor D and EGF domain-containing protein isoform X2 n=1 Tax=Antennarius striatus TaxID=241820 RepID=UPI0035AFB369
MGLEPLWTLLVLLRAARAQTVFPPECSLGGHSVLQNPYRSATFSSSWLQQSSLQDFICDHSLTPGWYQFQIFDKPAVMPTECVEVNHCGTQAPVWLSLGAGESLPGPLEVRQLTACAAWQFFSGGGKDCCMFRIPVSVRNCGGFYVYLLQPTQGCMGYCAQEMSDALPSTSPTCGPDEVDLAGTCQKKQPPTPSVPEIVSVAMGNAVYLRCSFGSSSNVSLGYVVAWSRLSPGGHKEELKQETTIQTSVVIELDGFNLRLGDKIYCSCSSFFLDVPDVSGASAESPEFFVGIKIRPEVSSVPEDGRMYELLFESTVPVPCPDGSASSSTGHCSLSLHLSTSSTDEGFLGADLTLSSCAVDLDRGPCRDGVCSRARIHFSPVTDFVKDGNRTTRISVDSIQTQDFLWNGYSPEPVEITVTDVPSAYCYVFTDPHILTFDGRRYDNYQVGTFVLYRSRSGPLEVHVRQWECGSVVHAASCVCGFVARDGGDVVGFDMCNGETGETKPRLSLKVKDPSRSGVRITESYQGRKVTMSFSSGVLVRADVSDWGMSLTLRAPGSDRGQTEGLCGTYDGQPDNDLQSAGGANLEDLQSFLSEWRLPPGTSLFDSAPSNPSATTPQKSCTCQAGPRLTPPRAIAPPTTSSDSACSHNTNVRLSGIIPSLDVTNEYAHWAELRTDTRASRRRFSGGGTSTRSRRQNRRYLHSSPPQRLSQSDLEGFTYFFPEDHEEAVQPDSSPTWPTPSGLTEQGAATQCREAVLNSSISSGCRLLLGEGIINHVVAMCVSDLQLKDELAWLTAALPLLENECERRVVEERRQEEDHPEVLAALRCPGLCSWNGRCSESGCVCFPGFGSYDCSVLSDQIPEIAQLENQGLCDVQRGDCSIVWVYGHGFKDSFELKCEFVREKFSDGEGVLDQPRLVSASFLDETTLECHLPLVDSHGTADSDVEPTTNQPLARWQIKVSNDGYSYSNAKILTLYDGACQVCSLHTEVLCTLKEKTCSIGGRCYSEGEANPSSPCFTCRPDRSRHTWSVEEKNEPPVLQPVPVPLRSFLGENFLFQLAARDPEGSAVLFALESGPDGAALTPDGLLTWRATDKTTDTHMLEVTAKDDCGAETRTSIQVSVTSCDCLNGASCSSDPKRPSGGGAYVCVCPDGFTGDRCETDIDDCKPNPCRLGRCIDGVASFSCICPPGMTGHTCREDVDECVAQPCFPGVGCRNTPGSFVCGACPPGFAGDGTNCALEGAVNPGKAPPPGVAPCSRRPCHPGVHCFESVHISAGFVCGPCPPGLHGDGRMCTATGGGSGAIGADGHDITKDMTPTPTSPRRPPSRTTRPKTTISGTRRLPPSDRKSTTTPQDRTSSGAFPPSRGSPSRHVTCADSPCFPGVPCEPTAAGSFRCGRCPYGYHGDGVSCRAVCRYPCGRNMACSLPNTCTCKDGYTGYSCHIAVCRPDCKNRGRCVEPDVCECPVGYGGPTCEEASCEPPCRHGGTCLARNLCTCSYGYVGPRCEIMVCNRHCENGGECVSPDVCECKPGWYGPTCNSAVCSPVCLNGGSCVKPDVCACPSGFYGSQCQIAVCSPPCKNGGQCMRNNVCSCPEGYTGKRCQKSVCEPMCMNKGKCVGPNTCSCASGWRGKRCNIPVCLQKCKNGGECLGPNTCQCPAGWEGLQCQTPVCRQRCVNGGRCVLPDYCHCRKGFKGLTCALKASQA